MKEKSYYEELGVPSDANDELIRSTYKALIRIYHPDAFQGDKLFAKEKIIRINAAFAVLSDSGKRKAYDEKSSSDLQSDDPEDMQGNFDDVFDTFSCMYSEDWKIATEFIPELKEQKYYLMKFSPSLAFVFQSFLLDSKRYDEAGKLVQALKINFLESKFGPDPNLHTLIEHAIMTGNRAFALDVNKALLVVGFRQAPRVLEVLAKKYESFAKNHYPLCNMRTLLPFDASFGLVPGAYTTKDNRRFKIDANHRAEAPIRRAGMPLYFDTVLDLVRSGLFSEEDIRTATLNSATFRTDTFT